MVAGALAKFADVDFDPKPYRGNYLPAKVQPRSLPDDKTIATYRAKLAHNPGWQWVYGMMATYGLRNHECFKLALEQFPIVRVLEVKG